MNKKLISYDLGDILRDMIEKAGNASPTLDIVQDIAQALLDINLLNAKLLVREHLEKIQSEYPKIAFFLIQHSLDEA